MTAGYSGTPLLKKLGAKEDSRVRLVGAPEGFDQWLEAQPGTLVWATPTEPADVILCFAHWEVDLIQRLDEAIPGLKVNGGLWVAWPKKASKVPTDIVENRLRDLILPMGLVDNKVCAIDDTWSGLRFVWRVENRPEAPGDQPRCENHHSRSYST